MPNPTLRPTPSLDGALFARWATIALLCAVVLAVSLRSRTKSSSPREAGLEPAEVDSAAFIETPVLPLEPLVIPPDFLEPLPVIEQAEEPIDSVELPLETESILPEPVLPPPLQIGEEEPPFEYLPAEEPSNPLLPGKEIESIESEPATPVEVSESFPIESESVEEILPIVDDTQPTEEFEYDDEDAELAAQLTPEELLTFSPSVAEISQKMLPEVQAAFQLTQHGATHAAHARFVRVLRRIAQAKDAEKMTEQYTRSLNEGLRALDEADDFMPAGGAPPRDLMAVASTHQTPMLKVHQSRYTLPHEAVALYHRYAQQKIGAAVEGEQAGSMALHGLGKIHARWAETESDSLLSMRHSMTMYRAALVAHPRNHLAANELGVLLARSGRYDQATIPLEWAAQLAGTATIYHNLAVVQQNRGQTALAAAAQAQSDRLAMLERKSGEVSRRHGVQWVAPQDLARVSDAHLATPQQSSTAAEPTPPPAPPTASRQSIATPAPRGGTWR